MGRRVSVDADALDAFIAVARMDMNVAVYGNHVRIDREFRECAIAMFELSINALDIKHIPDGEDSPDATAR